MSPEYKFVPFLGMKIYEGCSRLIPRTNSHSAVEGFQFKNKHPLFALTKQKQLGKFRPNNAGSIARVEITIRTKEIESIRLSKDGDFQELTNPELPLEPIVEQETRIPSESYTKPQSWNSQRLEYQYAIKSGDTVLEVDEYYGDQAAWYYHNIAGDIGPDGKRESFAVVPDKISFPGAYENLWEYEESNDNVGGFVRPNLNFLCMLLIEFALIFSNDWFTIPLHQKVNTLRFIEDLTIIDSFNVYCKILPVVDTSPDEHLWSIFTLKANEGYPFPGSQLFFLPNTADHFLEGDPIEETSKSREELVNLVWAVEHKYQDEGKVKNRDDEESAKIPDPPEVGKYPLYRLKTHLPLNWIPYIPTQKSQRGDIVLRRGRTDERSSIENPQYKGVILSGSKEINDEEIPSTTIELTRRHKLIAFRPEEWELTRDDEWSKWRLKKARSKEIYVWTAWNKRPGKKPGFGWLKFDYVIEK